MATIDRRRFLARAVQLVAGAGLVVGCDVLPESLKSPTAQGSPVAAKPGPEGTKQPTGKVTPAASASAAAASPTGAAVVPSTAQPSSTAAATSAEGPHLAVVRGASPEDITKAAVDALGGIGRFVAKGQRVLIKPNICTSQPPEYAATTNPQVVATLVTLCREAGASRVLVLDGPFSGISSAYRTSGIEAAVKAVGGEMEMMSGLKYVQTPIPQGKDLKAWSIYEDALKFDVLINVPIAKHHNLARLTVGMKNLLGLVDDRGAFHSNIGQRLADLSTVLRPALVVVDAVRILVDNGPTGGDLNDVRATNLVIAGTDPVAADSFAATLFGLKGDDLAYVRAGAEMGLGVKDLSQVTIAELSR